MEFQTKETNFHNEFFPNHASKKYETNHLKKRIVSTFEKCSHKIFWRRSRSDFEFLSWSMKFQQKRKNYEILIDFNQNLIMFQIKGSYFHN